ncbi:MAG TPA: DRTGG domain-containing protein [Salinivirgaceae bacterium]|nr:DRTGG domain-containing protein [Salinivirgaceae bacterium]
MTVNDIKEKLNLTVYAGAAGLNREVTGGYVSDLLSDVMGHSSEGQIWITLQTHKNIIAIASLKELAGIILVQGFEPDADTQKQAEDEQIPILGTHLSTFEISGKLYNLLHKCCE